MAQLVVKMLKRRESLRQEAYTTLVSVHKSMILMKFSNYDNNYNNKNNNNCKRRIQYWSVLILLSIHSDEDNYDYENEDVDNENQNS